MILLKNGTIYAPAYLGPIDLLIAGNQVAALGHNLNIPTIYLRETIDLKGKWVFPGLIDNHIHIAGAGGEGGPGSRTEGISIGQLLPAGITSVVGCLGTDGVSRSVESVLMKAKKLKAQGISAWVYTGSYQIPPPTLTGDIARDIALIDEVIGVGELALADHRSSMPGLSDFVRIIQQARIGGMIGGKSGIVNIHIGDYGPPFEYLEQALAIPGIHCGQMLPTHCNRTRAVFERCKEYAAQGFIDMTTSSYPYFTDSEIKSSEGWRELLDCGVAPESVTLSSDAGGSLPRFDQAGRYLGMDEGDPASLLNELVDMIRINPGDRQWVEQALSTVTRNVAERLKLTDKGVIRPGGCADLIALDQNMGVEFLLAKGKIMMRDGRIADEPAVSMKE